MGVVMSYANGVPGFTYAPHSHHSHSFHSTYSHSRSRATHIPTNAASALVKGLLVVVATPIILGTVAAAIAFLAIPLFAAFTLAIGTLIGSAIIFNAILLIAAATLFQIFLSALFSASRIF